MQFLANRLLCINVWDPGLLIIKQHRSLLNMKYVKVFKFRPIFNNHRVHNLLMEHYENYNYKFSLCSTEQTYTNAYILNSLAVNRPAICVY